MALSLSQEKSVFSAAHCVCVLYVCGCVGEWHGMVCVSVCGVCVVCEGMVCVCLWCSCGICDICGMCV